MTCPPQYKDSPLGQFYGIGEVGGKNIS